MSKRLEVRGVTYAFDEYGDSGPLLLFGHGMYFDRTMFAEVARELSGAYRCVCIDWLGHGESGLREEGWSVQDLVDDVAALIEALGAREAVLVGLSQGAAVFTRTALQHPSKVRALVVMNATPMAQPEAVIQRNEASAQALLAGDEPKITALFDTVASRMFSPKTLADDPGLVANARSRMERHPRKGLALAARLGSSYRSITEQMSTLAVPTLVLWGEDDQLGPMALLEHYRRIPDVSIKTFSGAGHSVALEKPAAVADALKQFLAQQQIG